MHDLPRHPGRAQRAQGRGGRLEVEALDLPRQLIAGDAERAAQNGGVGVALLHVALDWLEREGPRALWISVWSENYGAQRFYGRHGFEHAGEYEFIVGEQRDREFMYRRKPAMEMGSE